MTTILLVIHVLLAVSLVGIVLIQKSEGGGLGIGGGMSGFMTGRSQANLLTRTTAILAACFMLTSIALTILHARAHGVQPSLLDQIPAEAQPHPAAPAPAAPAPKSAAVPAKPSVPLAK